jgi:hypothetical protein
VQKLLWNRDRDDRSLGTLAAYLSVAFVLALWFVLIGLLWATPAYPAAVEQAVDHTDIVRTAKAAAVAAGVDVDRDDCSRFEVTKRAAMLLANEQAGLLDKPGGANCQGYATDIIAYRSGVIVDILGAGPDGPNTAHWIPLSPVDPSRWRPPLEPAPTSPVPTPVPAPVPGEPGLPVPATADLAAVNAKLDSILYAVEQLRQQQTADTEKVQSQIDQVVKNAERSTVPLILKILSLGTVK